MRVLLIDNYDSFTFNLSQYVQMLGHTVEVVLNDAIQVTDIAQCPPDAIILSPGPGRPENAGQMSQVIHTFYQTIPILGVCLGHQAIAQCFGAQIVSADRIMHGKTSLIRHEQTDLFAHIPNPTEVARYHSLIIDPDSLPSGFSVTAWSDDPHHAPEIMAIAHHHYPLYGIQFHPEAILTHCGLNILENYLKSRPIPSKLGNSRD